MRCYRPKEAKAVEDVERCLIDPLPLLTPLLNFEVEVEKSHGGIIVLALKHVENIETVIGQVNGIMPGAIGTKVSVPERDEQGVRGGFVGLADTVGKGSMGGA